MERVYLELGKQRVFACALDWPGWCRAGKSEALALEALAAAAPRYARVAADAGFAFGINEGLDVVTRVPGSASTDFGVPGAVPDLDREPLAEPGAERLASLVAAAWRELDRVVAAAPAELRKGPRGGGRDRDKIIAHVISAEASYIRSLGLRASTAGQEVPDPTWRPDVLDVLRNVRDGAPRTEKGWPPRYAARRIAWHVLDHAWEIEDRSVP